jgi:hypothetical protein
MLPILRLIPVGGVSLAILLLILALSPPGDSHGPLPTAMQPAHGPLLARTEHPQWRQFLIHAALRRAEELGALRLLPDTPLPSAPAEPDNPEAKTPEPALDVAGVPADQNQVNSDDATGSIVQPPDHSIPVDIGATSSTELPVFPVEEEPPVIMMPERNAPTDQGLNAPPAPEKPTASIRKPNPQRPPRTGAAAQPKIQQLNLLELLLGSFNADRAAGKTRR